MKQHKDEDSMEEQVLKIVKNDHESRICLLEKSVSNIEQILIIIQKDMKEGFSRLDQKIDSNFKWLIGTFISLFLIGLISQSLHWFK